MSNERERIEQILHRYDEIIASMADPAIVSDGARYLKLTKELSDIEPVVTRIRDKDRVEKELAEARELHTAADDEEMRQMAAEEVSRLLRANENLFAGGDLDEEAKDAFYQAVTKAYLLCKMQSRKKSRRPEEAVEED